MPHVLIAGSTGSGKSVAINSFLCAILFRASPEEVKLLMVDPKRVELTGYNGIPHLIAPVIVDPKQVLSALKWALNQMDDRYKQFAEVGARNIQSFNELSGFQAMPYILIVIDELADIMLYAAAEVETAITRLAQMARATGIHLIVSTQRPSTDVVTGLIKANIPCRIAFNVASMVDSRVIIDMPGAEKLLGRGDMLYIPPEQAKPTRIQGTYISNKEIDALIKYLRDQGVRPAYDQAVTEKYPSGKVIVPSDGEVGELDELAEEAIKVILTDKRASASLFQRRFKIGYTRAARILDQLEKLRIIGAGEGAKARELLVSNLEEGLARLKGTAK
jgi:S-DNA-T family DNA segregation ATPase FtsK/SpoIIIE